jgi:hypothetical protein
MRLLSHIWVLNQDFTLGPGPYCFHVHGRLTNKCDALLPEPNIKPVFAQLYVYDLDEALQVWIQTNPKVELNTMLTLQQLLFEYNIFVPFMKQAYETLHEEQEQGNDHLDLVMHLRFQLEIDVQCYNFLQINETTIFLLGDGKVPNAFCDSDLFERRRTTMYQ